MGKRFTATEKWDDPDYLSLSAETKILWQYLCDKCDQAGVIKFSTTIAKFFINGQEDLSENLTKLEMLGWVEWITETKLWLPKFISFQNGKLSNACPAHKPIFALLEKHSLSDRVLIGYPYPTGKGNGKGNGKAPAEIEKTEDCSQDSTPVHSEQNRKPGKPNVNPCKPPLAQAEAEAEKEKNHTGGGNHPQDTGKIIEYAKTLSWEISISEAQDIQDYYAPPGGDGVWRDKKGAVITNWRRCIVNCKKNQKVKKPKLSPVYEYMEQIERERQGATW